MQHSMLHDSDPSSAGVRYALYRLALSDEMQIQIFYSAQSVLELREAAPRNSIFMQQPYLLCFHEPPCSRTPLHAA